ncbi:MAG: fatty acid cis/trans isomerase [Campylobacterota bacterium]|nr:fatty acid cis/trans isomerase [Campylobacterota bacterium]
MLRYVYSIPLLLLVFSACSVEPLQPVEVAVASKRVDYVQEVKPILDKRCVVCHSCYNSPCQVKLSSFEGIDRGTSKMAVYGNRLSAADPTRLFVDAQDTQEWRSKGFSSVLDSSSQVGTNNSIMLLLLDHKMQNPESEGEYFSESDDLVCAKDQEELAEFLDDNPNQGMPFGFPALNDDEFKTIEQWLAQGAPPPTKLQDKLSKSASKVAQKSIRRFEEFFNNQDAKHVMSARYIYEHLFLAHLSFKSSPDEFFELVRSVTPSPEPIEIIDTIRPYDDPEVEKFYYRFRKIHSTIVHKTHMVYDLDDDKLQRYKKLFIEPAWDKEPFIVGYKTDYNDQPFRVFDQIPALLRYKFLLDNSEYVIRTFIRGPVCKGQIALNVINDHFWVMFMNPEYDLSLKNRDYFSKEYDNLRIYTESGSDSKLLNTFSDEYINLALKYDKERLKFYDETYTDGLAIESIWKGENASSAPFLTIFRHFDSASVHKGALGGAPKTAWVIDFPLLERIYYALVAGFDIYGNIGHQVNARRYMSRLRVEGESNFVNLLPKDDRKKIFDLAYIDVDDKELFFISDNEAKIKYTKVDSTRELFEKVINTHLLKSCDIKLDEINYFSANDREPNLPEEYTTIESYKQGFRSLVKKGLAFVQAVNGYNSNLAYIRIKNIPNSKDVTATAIIHRWHDNVSFMFNEKDRLDSSKDDLDFIEGLIGSYPNLFLVVDFKDLPDFFDMMHHYDGSDKYIAKFLKYGVNRGDDDFWQTYDWFQARFYEENPHEAGLLDLNRYYYKVLR